jgi:hypothetical protein
MTLRGTQDGDRSHRTSPGRDDLNLWDLEERFWSSGAESARSTTANDAVMILPYAPGILRGGQVLEHVNRNTGWRTVEMKDRKLVRLGSVAVISYRVSAEKTGSPIYTALCASTYLLDNGGWLRLSHQQTSAN